MPGNPDGEVCPECWMQAAQPCPSCDGDRCSACCDCDDPWCTDDDDYADSDCRVRDYEYRPIFAPKGDPFQTMMGVELEVGGSWDSITRVVHKFDSDEDHLYMKEDCSITGVEIVTHPMTLEYARQYPFTEMLERLGFAGCHVNSRYGLHIHVDRNAFRDSPGRVLRRRADGEVARRARDGAVMRAPKQRSATHQMLWLLFMYRNVPALEKLARRRSDRWASFTKPRKGELKQKASHRGITSERYVAVNCNNDETYELRFFQSTLVPQEFYAALEFADASVRYTRQLKAQDVLKGNALSWPEFTKWAERHNYRALCTEILK